MSKTKVAASGDGLETIAEEGSSDALDKFNQALITGNFDEAIGKINSGEIKPFLDPESQYFARLAITKYCDNGLNKGKIRNLAIDNRVVNLAKKYKFFDCDITCLPILKFFGSESFSEYCPKESSASFAYCIGRCKSEYLILRKGLALLCSRDKEDFSRVVASLYGDDHLSLVVRKASAESLADRSVEAANEKGCCVIS